MNDYLPIFSELIQFRRGALQRPFRLRRRISRAVKRVVFYERGMSRENSARAVLARIIPAERVLALGWNDGILLFVIHHGFIDRGVIFLVPVH